MQPNREFVGLGGEFWANVRTISQEVGYTVKPKRQRGVSGQAGPIKVPSVAEIKAALESINLTVRHLVDAKGRLTSVGKRIIAYYEFRADALNRVVEPLLMDAERAARLFQKLQSEVASRANVPMNKQSKEKKRPAYFTGIINMLIDRSLGGLPCNYNPQELTTITWKNRPFRTLARRVDGAFAGAVDPVAVWEIKEYYYTTTFGSRVADGVYESLLDGMELEEAIRSLSALQGRSRYIQHLLMVDAYYTWWVKGRSYLCRIIDMLHMGFVDEVQIGEEVVTRIPEIVKDWIKEYETRVKGRKG